MSKLLFILFIAVICYLMKTMGAVYSALVNQFLHKSTSASISLCFCFNYILVVEKLKMILDAVNLKFNARTVG